MNCLCIKTYLDRNTFEVIFQSGEWYRHLGNCEMLSRYEVPNGTNKYNHMIALFKEKSNLILSQQQVCLTY